MAKPWERQEKDGETEINYEAFCIYRDMKANSPDKRRTLERVCSECGKSMSLITRWSSKFDWKKRVAAWDDEQDRIAREAAQKQMIDEIRIMRKRQAEAAKIMQIKAIRALSKMKDEDIKAADVSRLMDIGSKIERLARGDVGEVIEERDGGQATPAVQIYIPDNRRSKDDDNFEDLEV